MSRAEKILSVCKRCGAVGNTKQQHCIFCGEPLDKTMELKLKKDRGSLDVSNGKGILIEENGKKKITALSLLSLGFGVIAVLMLSLPIPTSGIVFGLSSVILAIVSLCQGKGGTLPAIVGCVLGVYTIFVNLFYFFWQFFYLFID